MVWSPDTRSMILRRFTARPTPGKVAYPSLSGPRWCWIAFIRFKRDSSTSPVGAYTPQIPHTARDHPAASIKPFSGREPFHDRGELRLLRGPVVLLFGGAQRALPHRSLQGGGVAELLDRPGARVDGVRDREAALERLDDVPAQRPLRREDGAAGGHRLEQFVRRPHLVVHVRRVEHRRP